MAQQTVVTLIDDIDATRTADETVKFGLDGRELEIDLASDNAQKLRRLLEPFVKAARRGGRTQSRSSSNGSHGATPNRERTRAIRAWAIANNWQISDRGRIPAEVIEAWSSAGAPMNSSPYAPKPTFVDPDPVPATPWNKLDDDQKAQAKAWSAANGIEPKRWTRNAVARDEMSGFAQNNDTEGAKAYMNAL